MDDTKDIQKTDTLSRFLDVQSVRTNPFGLNRAGERLYRRTERMCAALYLLTSHIPEGEKIRSEIRENAIGLLTDTLALRDEMRSVQSRKIIDFQARIRKLFSLVRILAVSGFISIPNSETVADALDELGNFTSASQRSALSESISISRDELMDIGKGTNSQDTARSVKDIGPKSFIKDNSSVSDKNNVSNTNTNSKRTTNLRVQSIIEVVRAGGSLGIKDIAANLPEYSEKMIQREILALVSAGQIQKIGLKRWSKYSLPA